MWDFQLNIKVAQQSHEDQSSLDQKEVLNAFCKDGGESLLNISLEEILAANAVEHTAVFGNETGRVPGS